VNAVHLAAGICMVGAATLLGVFVPSVEEGTFNDLSATTAGLLAAQFMIGALMFAGQTNDAFKGVVHVVPPLAAIDGLVVLLFAVVRVRSFCRDPDDSGPRRKAPRGRGSSHHQRSPGSRGGRGPAEADVEFDLLIAETAALDLLREQGVRPEEDHWQLKATRKAQVPAARRGEGSR